MMKLILVLLSLLATSCSSTPPNEAFIVQEICGRDLSHHPIYRAKVPVDWKRIDPLPDQSIEDTTKAICEFTIIDSEETLRITIHNFPNDGPQPRIAPEAQIARWKRQFNQLNSLTVTPEAHGGFQGLLLQAEGIQNGKAISVTAWAMQLGAEHYATLSKSKLPEADQMKAEYTIKAVGSQKLMALHHSSILDFGNSFELIHEIFDL